MLLGPGTGAEAEGNDTEEMNRGGWQTHPLIESKQLEVTKSFKREVIAFR